MIRSWIYLVDYDVTDRGLEFRKSPIRAGNLSPRGLRAMMFSWKHPIVHPISCSRWHNSPSYTEKMFIEDCLADISRYYDKGIKK